MPVDRQQKLEQARRLRSDAERARRLAIQITQDEDRQGLERYADELDRQAAVVEEELDAASRA